MKLVKMAGLAALVALAAVTAIVIAGGGLASRRSRSS
jgi:hypothetical protein